MRQAYLIIAHNNFKTLQRLIDSLDCEQTDFYVHIDKKVKVMPELNCEKGQLFILVKRIDVRWGSVSQLKVEFLLMEEAFKNGPYDFYHIISGTHIALKPVEYINEFFAGKIGQNLTRVWLKDEGDADFKLRRIHFCVGSLKYGSPLRQKMVNVVWRGVLAIQKIAGIRRLKDEVFKKSDQWCSLSEKAVKHLLDRKGTILNKYRFSFCPDEYFIATELAADITDCKDLLYADFKGTGPRELDVNEIIMLRETAFIFARKVGDGF